ncbi:uncharacterized protein [Montipora capricornis]|uniref:uncharacterized protein isoform X3 n=1 Tax=Montipora capricornis TaxID=246305 RepID=UPI0035F10A8F
MKVTFFPLRILVAVQMKVFSLTKVLQVATKTVLNYMEVLMKARMMTSKDKLFRKTKLTLMTSVVQTMSMSVQEMKMNSCWMSLKQKRTCKSTMKHRLFQKNVKQQSQTALI